VKFPKWADKKTLAQASDLSEQGALAMLGAWASPR
jgi:hypothetical protein